jgi:hypothetical protein
MFGKKKIIGIKVWKEKIIGIKVQEKKVKSEISGKFAIFYYFKHFKLLK